jgi:tRNA (adenine37-N6)-methyltransferase
LREQITLEPIGRVSNSRTEPLDDDWDSVESAIALDPERFTADSTAGLAEFSHLEVIYSFNRVPEAEIQTGSRRPRGRADWPKVGIFAQRGKARPNRLGVTACRLIAVDGLTLRVQGLDAIHGTPVLDIKPVMRGFLPRGEIREPAWAEELMLGYW